jgi:hypothetical protein
MQPTQHGYQLGLKTSIREKFHERAIAKEGQLAKEISSGVKAQESESGAHAQKIA